MLKFTLVKLLIAAALVGCPVIPAAASLALFYIEGQAQQHCPSDVVVWLNLPTHIYHWKGMRWYGHTKSGAYVCKKEADENGSRGAVNGQ